MKDLDGVQSALKENDELKSANSTLQLKVDELKDEVTVLNDNNYLVSSI